MIQVMDSVAPGHRGGPKNNPRLMEKEQIFGIWFF
jgi:hypothetical protein